jgi:hypothetical protein
LVYELVEGCFEVGILGSHYFDCLSIEANADQAPRNEQDRKRGSQTAKDARRTPKQHSGGDDLGLAEAIGKNSRGDTREGKHDEQARLQPAEFRVAYAEMLPKKGKQGIEDLTIRKVDKID